MRSCADAPFSCSEYALRPTCSAAINVVCRCQENGSMGASLHFAKHARRASY
jgi:hypothetical protein